MYRVVGVVHASVPRRLAAAKVPSASKRKLVNVTASCDVNVVVNV